MNAAKVLQASLLILVGVALGFIAVRIAIFVSDSPDTSAVDPSSPPLVETIKLPDRLVDLDSGADRSLASSSKPYTAVVLLASQCSPCMQELPGWDSLAQRVDSEIDYVFVFSGLTRSYQRQLARQQFRFEAASLFDSTHAIQSLNVGVVAPSAYLIGRSGNVIIAGSPFQNDAVKAVYFAAERGEVLQ